MTKARDLSSIISGGFTDSDIPNLAASKITSGTFADARLPSTALNSNVSVPNQSAFKNIIINGDMSIAQRGTVTGINTNTYTLDRWITEGDDATLTVSQDTSVPSAQGFGKSLKIAVTTANASVAADELQKIAQRIEGQFLQQLLYGTSSAKSFTLSFWVKSNITGTYAMEFQNDDNNKVQTATYTISSADTWEKKTITISGDTASGFDNDANRSFRVLWWLAAGSNYTSNNASSGAWIARSSNIDSIAYGHAVNVTSSTSNTFYLTGCQLEVGTSASDFEFLPYDVNLQRCQRYLFTVTSPSGQGRFASGGFFTGTGADVIVSFPVEMRSSYSMSYSSLSDFRITSHTASSALASLVLDTSNCLTAANVRPTGSTTPGVAGNYCLLYTSSSSAKLFFDAEL